MDDFAVFILTHGRPDNVITFESLKKYGYTGPVYLVVDDKDKALDQYKEKYGDSVQVFSKSDIAKTFDSADNFNDQRAIIYARNASFEIARTLGIKYFAQFDDDYTSFQYRFNDQNQYAPKVLKNLDRVFEALLKFYKVSGAASVAMAQGGDFIGGEQSSSAKQVQLKRKCMNSFICSTDRPFKFVGRINEDVNTYTSLASKGLLMFTTNQVNLNQAQTQTSTGGMTELYLSSGTYVKSFYSVIFQPSSVKIRMMGTNNRRLHHSITWKNTVPKIIRESYKKGGGAVV